MQYDDSHINRRVKYTDRSGMTHHGYIRGVIGSVKQIDFAKDGSRKNTFYVPFDTIELTEVGDETAHTS